ncbi:MAG: APC family permease [Clostridia bacterium]|nr:APC family permease [Clostridia bacterium]
MESKRYGLMTAMAMIVGTVIGSGIFFKSDNILYYTRGSILRGVAILIISAFAIVFGCLSLNNLVKRSSASGGIVSWAYQYCGRRVASAYGWFFTFIYYPTLAVIVSWVVGIYTSILLGFSASSYVQLAIGFSYLLLCCLYNMIAPRFSGFFQRMATLIKLIPLLLIAVLGLLFGHGVTAPEGLMPVKASQVSWLAAIGPIAFAFDGWVVVTSITSELKDSKRHMGLALVISPLFILVVYLAYFLGVTKLLGVNTILGLGDNHVGLAASTLFGPLGAKLLLIGILISVMGTLNGVVMAGIRVPHVLATEGLLPHDKNLKQMNPRFNMPLKAGLMFIILCTVWYVLHTLTLMYGLLGQSDISEISIVMQYLLYAILYYQIFKLYRKGEVKGPLNGVLFPLLAILGSLFILVGGLQNPLAPLYALFCVFIMALGFVYAKKDGAWYSFNDES